jgi:hypothetical protein
LIPATHSRLKKRPHVVLYPHEANPRPPQNESLFDEYFPREDDKDMRDGACRVIAHYDLLPVKRKKFRQIMKIRLKLTRGGKYHLTSLSLYIYFDFGLVSKVTSVICATNNASVDKPTNISSKDRFTPIPITMTGKIGTTDKKTGSMQGGVNISKFTAKATYGVEKQKEATKEIKVEFPTAASINRSGEGSRTASWVVKQGSVPNGIPVDDFNIVLGLELDSVPLIVGYTIKAYTVVAHGDTQQHLGETPTPSKISRAQCLNTRNFYAIRH